MWKMVTINLFFNIFKTKYLRLDTNSAVILLRLDTNSAVKCSKKIYITV